MDSSSDRFRTSEKPEKSDFHGTDEAGILAASGHSHSSAACPECVHGPCQLEENKCCSLASLCMGEQGQVVEITGDASTRRRLLEMGLTRGSIVHAVRKAPLGDPVQYHLRGYALSLRRELARLVQVVPVLQS